MVSADTTAEARAAQLAAYRVMTPAERVGVAAALSEDARVVLLAGIASRFPSLSETDRLDELRRILNGQGAEVPLDIGS